jgi:hypothetical protein
MKCKLLTVAFFLALFLAKGAQAQNQYYLPHVANGNFGTVSFRMTFILFNNTDASVVAILKLTDDDGNPLNMTIGGLGSGSQFNITLGAGATNILQTDGSGSAAVGAATVTATAAIGVSAIFTVYDANGNYMTEAGVGSSDSSTEFVLPVDVTGPFNTGLALFNAGSGNAAITAILRGTDGVESARATMSLKGNGHLAKFATELFPSLSNFRGTLVVQSSIPIAALVLREYKTSLKTSYTSLPAVPRSSTKLTMNLAHVANGSYGSISFKTSFLIFNISPSPANVALALTKDDGSPFIVSIPGSGPGTGTNSSFTFTLAAGASVFLQTDGSGAGTAGAATITSNIPVGAAAIFTVLDSQGQFQTEAGVGDSPVLTSLTLPVDITGSFDTGVAFFNPGSSSMVLTFRLLDASGVLVNSKTQPLASKNHLATFVDNIFPGTSNFRGSLAISSTGGVAATTLRQYDYGRTYTTLPTAAGTATGKTAIAPLLSRTQTGITALPNDPDVNVNATLPSGFKLTGTISGAGQGASVYASAGGTNIFAGTVNSLTGKYLVVVPAGTYSLTVCYLFSGTPSNTEVTGTYTDPTSVQVSGDTTRNITLPSVTLFNVSGTVSGLSGLPSGLTASTPTISFTSSNNTVQGQFTLNASGSYQGVLPTGNYIVCLLKTPIQFLPLQIESLELYQIGTLTVGTGPATGNYTTPATVKLSGTVRGAGLTSMPTGTAVLASDTTAAPITQITCCAPPDTSYATADLSGQYQMVLAQNRSFTVGVSVPLGQGVSFLGVLNYPISSGAVSMGADTTLDFNIPGLPRRPSIFGRVTDSSGNGVANVVISAYSQSITDAANVGFSASGKTDPNGNYSIAVLGGTNYQLTFSPPTPQP